MTKKELIDSVASQTGMGVTETTKTVEALFETIRTSVKVDKPIFVRGFGTFELKKTAARKARNIHTGADIFIPEGKKPVFKASKNFME